MSQPAFHLSDDSAPSTLQRRRLSGYYDLDDHGYHVLSAGYNSFGDMGTTDEQNHTRRTRRADLISWEEEFVRGLACPAKQ
jgi:hypothetical protein